MMDRRIIVVLSLCFLIYHFSTTESRMISKGVDSSGGCKFTNKSYGVGEKWKLPSVCQLYTCLKGGAVDKLTCSELLPRGCRLTKEEVTESWPDCCGPQACQPGPYTPQHTKDLYY